MGLIAKLRLLFKASKPAGEFIDQIKGAKLKYKTLPFWITMVGTLGSLLAAAQGVIPVNAGIIIGSVLSGFYAILRGIDKASQEGIKNPILTSEFGHIVVTSIGAVLLAIQQTGFNSPVLVAAIAFLGTTFGVSQGVAANQPQDLPNIETPK